MLPVLRVSKVSGGLLVLRLLGALASSLSGILPNPQVKLFLLKMKTEIPTLPFSQAALGKYEWGLAAMTLFPSGPWGIAYLQDCQLRFLRSSEHIGRRQRIIRGFFCWCWLSALNALWRRSVPFFPVLQIQKLRYKGWSDLGRASQPQGQIPKSHPDISAIPCS